MSINIAHDITERRLARLEQEQQAQLLSQAGVAFGQGLDEAAVAAALLDLVVPALARHGSIVRDGERPGVREAVKLVAAARRSGAPARGAEVVAIPVPPLGTLVLEGMRASAEPLAVELAQRAGLAARNARLLAAERAARADAEGALRGIYASIRALRESKDRFASLVDATAQIVWTTGPDGGDPTSPQWATYTGWPKPSNDAVHPDDRERVHAMWQESLEKGTPFVAEYRIRRTDGEYRTFAARGVPVRQADGTVREWVGTCTDVTERVEAERALRESEERLRKFNEDLEGRVRERTRALEAVNRELEAFSSAVSHDLRAPLRGVSAYAEVLEEHADGLGAEGLDALARLRGDVRRMGVIIDDLLALSRAAKEELRRERIDLAPIARDVVERLRRGDPSRKVEVVIDPEIPAEADPRALRVLLDNLIGNAWKFTKGTPVARIEVGSRAEADGRVYHVSDNGAGFDMARAGRLFRPFQRLHGGAYEGTGLGLSTVARLVDRHGGRVWAQAAPGEGATFFFTLGAP
jgi:PAS domain S-box-containing protein